MKTYYWKLKKGYKTMNSRNDLKKGIANLSKKPSTAQQLLEQSNRTSDTPIKKYKRPIKSRQIHIMTYPNIVSELDALADDKQISRNELITQIFKNYIEKEHKRKRG